MPPLPFISTGFSFFISCLALHLTQYPIVAICFFSFTSDPPREYSRGKIRNLQASRMKNVRPRSRFMETRGHIQNQSLPVSDEFGAAANRGLR